MKLIMKILLYILEKIRYAVCSMIIIIIALPLVPIIVFTNWSGIWILCIANDECCSLSKARKLYKENKDGKYSDRNITYSEDGIFGNNASASNIYKFSDSFNSSGIGSSPSTFHNYQTNPAYSYLSYNVYNHNR